MIIEIEVNGKRVRAQRGEMILNTLRDNGIHIPTLCSLNGYKPTGACRLCVVEVDGMKELVPACSFAVDEWMSIRTHSPRVIKARKTIMELLLSNHPDDCLYCGHEGGCGLQQLASEMSIAERHFSTRPDRKKIDTTSPALIHDPSKCVLCGRCVRICNKEQAVSALDFMNRGGKTRVGTLLDKGLNYSSCINCGQCVQVCPTGSLKEADGIESLTRSLSDHETFQIAIVDPAVGLAIGELFGMKGGKDLSPLIFAALRKIGFHKVYEGHWSYLLESKYLASYMSSNENEINYPFITGSCPAITQFVNQNHPDLSSHLSPVLPGRYLLVKWIREQISALPTESIAKLNIVYFSPCTALKRESKMAPFNRDPIRIDHVLSTRETSRLIRLFGLRFEELNQETADPINLNTSAKGALGSQVGGFLELLIEDLLEKQQNDLSKGQHYSRLRGLKMQKDIALPVPEASYSFLGLSQTSNVDEYFTSNRAKDTEPNIVECMACGYGCINGGGQPFHNGGKELKSRLKAVYDLVDQVSGMPAILDPGQAGWPEWKIEDLMISSLLSKE